MNRSMNPQRALACWHSRDEKILCGTTSVLFDAEESNAWPSLRVYACHTSSMSKPIGPRVGEMIAMEEAAGMMRLDYYHDFAKAVKKSKADIHQGLSSVRRAKASGWPGTARPPRATSSSTTVA